MWQDGTGFPEPALDQFNQVTSGEALRWLLGGMSFFVALGTYTKLFDPEAKRPYVPKTTLAPPEILATLDRN